MLTLLRFCDKMLCGSNSELYGNIYLRFHHTFYLLLKNRSIFNFSYINA